MKSLKKLVITLSFLLAFSSSIFAGALPVKTMPLGDGINATGYVRVVLELTDDAIGLDMGCILHQEEAAAAWNNGMATMMVNLKTESPTLAGYNGTGWDLVNNIKAVDKNKEIAIWFTVDAVANTYGISAQMEDETEVTTIFTDYVSRSSVKGQLSDIAKFCSVFVNDKNGQTIKAVKVVKDAEIVTSIVPYVFPMPIYGDTTEVAICDNATYQYDGKALNTAGIHTKTFTSAGGLDSIVSINLTVNPTYMMGDTTDYVTSDEMFKTVGSQVLVAKSETFKSCKECDSIVASYVELTYAENVYSDSTTIEVFDTTNIEVFDTTYITVQDTIIFAMTSGINDANVESVLVKVYPNPATTMLKVSIADISALATTKVQLYNITGKMVAEQTLTSAITSMDISTLSGGSYILKIVQGTDLIDSKMIVIQ